MKTTSGRKLRFRGSRVLRCKRRIYGCPLPPEKILAKLRAPDQKATWMLLDRAVFDREKYWSTKRL
jgi:hypothetical protein